MLQSAAVYPATLAVLKKLMKLPSLHQFNLVGGTALALQIGHRISVDLDLFTTNKFDKEQLYESLKSVGNVEKMAESEVFLQVTIDNIKVDLLKYPYDLVADFIELEEIRLLPIEKIVSMKLSAIGGRGAKKDFFDLYFLLEKYSFNDLLALFEADFPNTNTFHILKSLTFFDDADLEPNPIMLKKVDWKIVKKTIIKKVNDYFRK